MVHIPGQFPVTHRFGEMMLPALMEEEVVIRSVVLILWVSTQGNGDFSPFGNNISIHNPTDSLYGVNLSNTQ